MFIRTCLAGLVTTAFVGVAMAEAQVPGQKIDNGLGELAHYSLWADSKLPAGLPKRKSCAWWSCRILKSR